MLDIRIFREQPDIIRKALKDRGEDLSPVDKVVELDSQRRVLIEDTETL